MSVAVSEIHFFLAAAVGLLGCAVIKAVNPRWRTIERAVAGLALLGVVAGLGLSAVRRGAWPLTGTTELIIASAGAATLWHLLDKHVCQLRWGGLIYAAIAALLIGGVVRWPVAQSASLGHSAPQTWLFPSHLALVLACGAFVEGGSLALACLLTEIQAHGICSEGAGRYAVLPGLPLLTASLLLSAVAGLYTGGVYWEWTVAESWRLLAWLFHAVLWCASVLLSWRGRRLWVLTALGLIPTLLVLTTAGR